MSWKGADVSPLLLTQNLKVKTTSHVSAETSTGVYDHFLFCGWRKCVCRAWPRWGGRPALWRRYGNCPGKTVNVRKRQRTHHLDQVPCFLFLTASSCSSSQRASITFLGADTGTQIPIAVYSPNGHWALTATAVKVLKQGNPGPRGMFSH